MRSEQILPRGRRFLPAARRVAAATICVVGLAYVGVTLAREWEEVSMLIATVSPWWIAGSLASAAVSMALIALQWRDVMLANGVVVSRRDAVTMYFRGEVGKYIPGGIWPVIGRAELARQIGVPSQAAYSGVLVGLGARYAAAALICLAGLFVLSDSTTNRLWLVAAVTASAGLYPWLWRKFTVKAERLSKGKLVLPGTLLSLKLIAATIPSWALIAAATWMAARSLDPGAGFWIVAYAAVASWLAGFLVVLAPGGLGVREAVFLALVGPLPTGVAAAAALLSRLAFILVDGAGAILASASAQRSKAAAREDPSSS